MSVQPQHAAAAGVVARAAAKLARLRLLARVAGMVGVVGAAALGGAAAAHAAADPFYLDLLRDGMQSYDRGDYAAASKQLRVACFGMLDEPQQLAECLTRLGLAQGAAGNTDGFRETFRRIVEVEERFGAYGKADLPAAVRAAFEQRALAAVPAGTLQTIPGFRALLSRKQEAQVAALPPRERRRQLEELLAKEPRSVVWNVMLAEIELAEGKAAPAVTRAEAAAALAPRDPRALCVRGQARAAARRCTEAVVDLESCPAAGTAAAAGGAGAAAGAGGGAGSAGAGGTGDDPGHRGAAALLACRVELGQWRQAEEQVRTFPAAWKQERDFAALIRQVAKHPSTATPPAGSKGGAPAAAPAAGGAPPTTGAAGATSGTRPAGAPGAPGTPGAAPAAGQAAAKAPAGAAGAAGTSASGGSGGTAGSAGTTGASGTAGAGTRSGTPGTASGAAGTAPGAAGIASGAPGTSGGAKAAPPGSAAAAGTPAVPRPLAPLSAAEREAMARTERLLTATSVSDLREALRLARQLADAHPDSKEAQYLAGEAAYRNSRWSEAAAYFRRGGPPGDDHPELLFYMAVSYYEVGDRPGAAAALKRSLPNLQRTPFVETYVKRILGQ